MENTEQKVFDILYDNSLAWDVVKKRLYSQDGLETDSYGIFRSDNNIHIGTVGERYTPYQNSQLATQFIKACEQVGIGEVRGGSLGRGDKVYIQAKLEDEYVANDTIKRWVTALNSHDGTSSIGFGSSNTVVICQNTFFKAFQGNISRFKHTINANEKIEYFVQELNNILIQEKELMEKYKKLSTVKVEDGHIDSLLKKIFEVDDLNDPEFSTRKANQIAKATQTIKDNGINTHGNTLWGVFNGVTNYTNYVATKPENRLEYLMVGKGYSTNNLALNTLLEFAN